MRKRKVPIDMTFQLSLMNELFGNETSQEIEEVFVMPEVEIIEPPKRFVYEHAIKENVLEQYPFLRDHQGEDCATVEKRFYINEEKGIQVTNGTGVGKAQPLHSNILTPNGWVKMGDIKKEEYSNSSS